MKGNKQQQYQVYKALKDCGYSYRQIEKLSNEFHNNSNISQIMRKFENKPISQEVLHKNLGKEGFLCVNLKCKVQKQDFPAFAVAIVQNVSANPFLKDCTLQLQELHR